MTKVTIFSGFLGAGKTTLIKKLIREAYPGEQLVLIENEFGEIGIDGGFLKEAGIEVTEMNSGCICCSLVGDFGKALQKVLAQYQPDRILIEPSGVGKLSDVISAVQGLQLDELQLDACVTVADASKCRLYIKNFGEFYNNQIAHANAIILSRTDQMAEEKLLEAIKLLRSQNANASIITTPWDQLSGATIREAMEQRDSLAGELEELVKQEQEGTCSCGHDHHEHEHHEHHHSHEDEGACTCGHDHHQHEHEHHEHHEHDCGCGCHHEAADHHEEHHHDHGEGCSCGHSHEHHHHADEVFQSFGLESPKQYRMEEIEGYLEALSEESTYGFVLRAKGIVPNADGGWIHFDYVPGESNVRMGSAGVTGRLCVIGAKLQEEALSALFHQS